jgi:hypothetical protein
MYLHKTVQTFGADRFMQIIYKRKCLVLTSKYF